MRGGLLGSGTLDSCLKLLVQYNVLSFSQKLSELSWSNITLLLIALLC